MSNSNERFDTTKTEVLKLKIKRKTAEKARGNTKNTDVKTSDYLNELIKRSADSFTFD
ncbi:MULTISPECIES: hypothetical protein [Vibrio]|uniref:hypothetical protein n=1 Tax=Vibrio TaxID=662 RepID=UPI0012FFF016|nr:hypothetical protein [Vibrio splendidus]